MKTQDSRQRSSSRSIVDADRVAAEWSRWHRRCAHVCTRGNVWGMWSFLLLFGVVGAITGFTAELPLFTQIGGILAGAAGAGFTVSIVAKVMLRGFEKDVASTAQRLVMVSWRQKEMLLAFDEHKLKVSWGLFNGALSSLRHGLLRNLVPAGGFLGRRDHAELLACMVDIVGTEKLENAVGEVPSQAEIRESWTVSELQKDEHLLAVPAVLALYARLNEDKQRTRESQVIREAFRLRGAEILDHMVESGALTASDEWSRSLAATLFGQDVLAGPVSTVQRLVELCIQVCEYADEGMEDVPLDLLAEIAGDGAQDSVRAKETV